MTNNKKFWFVIGSQELYGKEALEQVREDAQVIADYLNENGNLPFKLELHEQLATSADVITDIMKEVNYREEIAGVVTWMHTFSPAKMWIQGTKLLQKPLLHLATQFYNDISWENIDMDYMNLHQSAHGDREYGYINKRLNKNNEIVFGHWKDENTQIKVREWMLIANAYNESFNLKVARFGDNMRNVAVTDGDKIEAQIKFGWTVDYYGIGDLVAYVNEVSDSEINEQFETYQQLYDFDYRDYSVEKFNESVIEQIKYEVAIKKFLDDGAYTAFTTNFEDLHGMRQLPGLAVQRLNEQGYGFAGEGDWKTAALDRLLKIATQNKSTGFMEDYTYDLRSNQQRILGSHMLEVDPTLAGERPKIVVNPLGIGDKNDPARLVFDGKAGDGVVVTMLDLGTHFKFIVNEITAETLTAPAPNLPVARVLWKVKPSLEEGVKSWIEEGGGHHTVLSLELNTNQLVTLMKMFDAEYALIR
ncbi:L-arabinose isomerase [Staphylococcus succinus]|uniref:L-arabinose isomerase n=1 Tax=Staphylococcus succinus TaxID=61015 RepID=A0A9Q6HRD5_9STAP|nr:L-arabinose isomerase [Staphylococcus succinus]MEB8127462.1 L-arabinose isomerase [Staphylococcus succinus]PTI77656.1 L-arabinose isomerase [Staphylococcus succinus]